MPDEKNVEGKLESYYQHKIDQRWSGNTSKRSSVCDNQQLKMCFFLVSKEVPVTLTIKWRSSGHVTILFIIDGTSNKWCSLLKYGPKVFQSYPLNPRPQVKTKLSRWGSSKWPIHEGKTDDDFELNGYARNHRKHPKTTNGNFAVYWIYGQLTSNETTEIKIHHFPYKDSKII